MNKIARIAPMSPHEKMSTTLTTSRKISLLKLMSRKERAHSTIDLNIQLLLIKLNRLECQAKELKKSIIAANRELRGE